MFKIKRRLIIQKNSKQKQIFLFYFYLFFIYFYYTYYLFFTPTHDKNILNELFITIIYNPTNLSNNNNELQENKRYIKNIYI